MTDSDLMDQIVNDDINLSMSPDDDNLRDRLKDKWELLISNGKLSADEIDALNQTINLKDIINLCVLDDIRKDDADKSVPHSDDESVTGLLEDTENDSVTNEPIVREFVDFDIGSYSDDIDLTKSFLLGTANYEFFKEYFRIGVDKRNYPYVLDPFDNCYVLCGDCLCFVEFNKITNLLMIGKMFLDKNDDNRYLRRYYPDGSFRDGNMNILNNHNVVSDLYKDISDSYKIGLMVETKNYQYWENIFVRCDYHELYSNVLGLTFYPCDGFNSMNPEDRYLVSDKKIHLSFSYGRLAYVTPFYNMDYKYLGISIGQRCTTISVRPGGSDIMFKSPQIRSNRFNFKGGGLYK